MFQELEKIFHKPLPYEFYTADELWTDEHTSAEMLKYHLMKEVDVSSRNFSFIEKSVDWIQQYFFVSKDFSVIDFGCGPGLYTTLLAEKQAKVTGIDFSERSLNYARKTAQEKNLKIQYIHQNYLEFESTEKFDLIIMIMCDFCALSPEQRKTLLIKFKQVLKPEGRILLDVYSLQAFEKKQESSQIEINQLNEFWSPDKYYGFVNSFKYDREKLSLDKYTLIEENRTRTVYNWLQHFSPESLEKEFLSCGLKIETFLGDVAGSEFCSTKDEFAVVGKICGKFNSK